MKFRASIVVFLFALVLAPAGLASAPGACAATPDHAALVVDTGSHVTDYCVAIPQSGVSGLGLIQRASAQYGLDYLFGDNGQAVCRLAGVGSDDPNDCFSEYPYFWGYWHGSSSGNWSWASTGGGSYTVHPGDIDGWSYSTGQDGSSHTPPPETTYSQVCATQTSPSPSPSNEHHDGTKPKANHHRMQKRDRSHHRDHSQTGGSGMTSSPSAVAGATPAGSEGEKRKRGDDGNPASDEKHPAGHRSHGKQHAPAKVSTAPGSPVPTTSATPVSSEASGPSEGSGPPAAALGAVAIAAVLGGAGAVISRRRMGQR